MFHHTIGILCVFVAVISISNAAVGQTCQQSLDCGNTAEFCQVTRECTRTGWWTTRRRSCTETRVCALKQAVNGTCRDDEGCLSNRCRWPGMCVECGNSTDCAADQYCDSPPRFGHFKHPRGGKSSGSESSSEERGGRFGRRPFVRPTFTCIARVSFGGDCLRDEQCMNGLLCDGGKCVTQRECSFDRENKTSVGCQDGEKCHGAWDPLLPNKCVAFTNCTQDSDCTTGLCHQRPLDSDEDGDRSGSHSRGGKRGWRRPGRGPRGPRGPHNGRPKFGMIPQFFCAECDRTNNRCTATQFCAKFRCFDKKASGSYCVKNEMCSSGTCNNFRCN